VIKLLIEQGNVFLVFFASLLTFERRDHLIQNSVVRAFESPKNFDDC